MQRLDSRNQAMVVRSGSGPLVGVGGGGSLHASSSPPPQKLSRTFSEQSPLSSAAASSNSSSSNSNDINPLKSDPELQILLKRLDRIKKYKRFHGWKTRFLDRLEKFIYEEGMTPAQQACNDFDETLKKFVNRTILVTEFIDKGELSNTKKTVKAALALNEMCSRLQVVVAEVETLVPYSGREEKKHGFSKFHSGCALIRPNFHQYITMKVIEDALTEISLKADDVADRQQHELMDKYKVQVQRFCDIMADLGLYEVMMKCLEFSEEPPAEDESEGSELINFVIETHDGKKLELEIEADESIQNLKEIIAPGSNIAPSRQVLKFRGIELAPTAADNDNNKALEDFGIEDGSILTLEPLLIPIAVKCSSSSSNGKEVIQTNIMVDTTNKLGALKNQLQDSSGIAANNQKLSFNGDALESDNETMDFYGITAGCVLTLGPKTINVTVVMPNGNAQHGVEISPLDNRDGIQAKVAKTTGMAVPRQVLTLNGTELPFLLNAHEMGIQDGSILQLAKVPVTITTTMDDQQIKAMIDPTVTLREIKVQLEKECGIPADNQSLFLLNGGDDVLLDNDDKAVDDYGIQAGTALTLEPKLITVQVEMPDGQSSCAIAVKPSETSDAIKAKIEQATGMIVHRQVLKVDEVELPTDRTVKDMGIREGVGITVEIFKVPITVTTMDGHAIHVMVDPTDKLSDIQEQLVKESGIPVDSQNLYLGGDVLDGDNSRPAKDYGIQAGTELKLEPKSMQVNVEMPDGKVLTMNVKPCDSSNDIKAKIKKQTGMDVPRQVLKIVKDTGVVAVDNGVFQTAKDMGIGDGTAIQVDVFRIAVTIVTADGQEIKAMVEPGAKLEDMKLQLEKVFG